MKRDILSDKEFFKKVKALVKGHRLDPIPIMPVNVGKKMTLTARGRKALIERGIDPDKVTFIEGDE